jgi:hypothetical protein
MQNLGSFKGKIFLGEVSESGQLTLLVFVVLHLLCLGAKKTEKFTVHVPSLLFFLLSLSGFFLTEQSLKGALAITLALFALSIIISNRRSREILLQFCFVVLLLALLYNLKRAPIFGVSLGILIFLAVQRRQFVLPITFILLLLMFSVPLLRDRILSSYEHFMIVGGRGAIWEIALELLPRFPLGVGFDNGALLQSYSSDIPHNLTHFHSNALNFLVEIGWIPSLLFFSWIGRILYLNFRKNLALCCGIIAWQVAGIFEYNIGDSEVFLLAVLVLAHMHWRSGPTENCLVVKEKTKPKPHPV